VKFAGDPALMVEKVAVCSGSGSGLLKNFYVSGAHVYVSGDLHYHDAREAEDCGKGLVDIGHFGSERIVADFLGKNLQIALDKKNLAVTVDSCGLEKEPFKLI
jgi:putative NIF3 family GTP cyclohydrolase 1 type 2